MDFCKEMTVIIPFLNEGIEVEETIKSRRNGHLVGWLFQPTFLY